MSSKKGSSAANGSRPPYTELSRRERQIMDLLYQRGPLTSAQVQEALPSPPSYSAVRGILRILEEKGHVRHEQDGPRYVFKPTVSQDRVKTSMLRHMISTFFNGSAQEAVTALLTLPNSGLSEEDLGRLGRLIDDARKRGL
jgi:predicted transcriptional regulator